MGSLRAVEGKGTFTKEIDQALPAGAADLAVHCVKERRSAQLGAPHPHFQVQVAPAIAPAG